MPLSFIIPLLDVVMAPTEIIEDVVRSNPLITVLVIALLVFAVVMIIRTIRKRRKDRERETL